MLVRVWDYDFGKKNDLMGTAVVPFSEVGTWLNQETTLKLRLASACEGQPGGELHIGVKAVKKAVKQRRVKNR